MPLLRSLGRTFWGRAAINLALLTGLSHQFVRKLLAVQEFSRTGVAIHLGGWRIRLRKEAALAKLVQENAQPAGKVFSEPDAGFQAPSGP